jgi:hypothetical protein
MGSDVFQERAETLYQAVVKRFYVPEENLYRDYVAPREGDLTYATLWPFSSLISALNALVKLNDNYRQPLRDAFTVLERYYDPAAPIPAYDSYVRSEGGGQKYYDDNEWLGLDFLEAYHTLGDPWFLDQAKTMFEFAYSGWSAEMGGGIYWRENDPATKNTCSNGPAALLALKLYQETHDARYVELATQISEWLRRLRTEGAYYWDAMNSDGSIDKRTFTYNTATPLHSYVLLYQITGNPEYLMEAQALAQGAHRHFAPVHTTAGVSLYPKTPWFNAVLLKGYLALTQIDGNTRYIEAMRDGLEYAWTHALGHDGLLSGDWSGESGVDIPSQFILDQGAGVELLALIARFNTL